MGPGVHARKESNTPPLLSPSPSPLAPPPPGSQVTDHSPLPQAAYDSGLELLGRQEAGLALPRLEEALRESLAQMESCRAGCEGPEEHQREEEEEGTGSQGGLYEAIAGQELGGWRGHSARRRSRPCCIA